MEFKIEGWMVNLKWLADLLASRARNTRADAVAAGATFVAEAVQRKLPVLYTRGVSPLYTVYSATRTTLTDDRQREYWALFGNAKDGLLGDPSVKSPWYARNGTARKIWWWLRNPCHNLTFHELGYTGVPHRVYQLDESRWVAVPDDTTKPPLGGVKVSSETWYGAILDGYNGYRLWGDGGIGIAKRIRF